MPTSDASPLPTFITPDALLAHWQAHRRLTRRTIAAFPADQLFSFTIGGMRSYGELANELLGMPVPTLDGLLTGQWSSDAQGKGTTQGELLAVWDERTTAIDERFPRIPVAHFQDTVTAFGQWTMPAYALVLYLIDNEIHHRGQGYVYLRALGLEPPQFFDRG
jgi:uncharacterized damage-inducible protein DinB